MAQQLEQEKKDEFRSLILADTQNDLEPLIRKSSKFFKVSPKSGAPIYDVEITKFTDSQALAFVLISKHIAHSLDIIPTDFVNSEEASKLIGKSKAVAAARLNELAAKQLADRGGKGEFKLSGPTAGIRFIDKFDKKK